MEDKITPLIFMYKNTIQEVLYSLQQTNQNTFDFSIFLRYFLNKNKLNFSNLNEPVQVGVFSEYPSYENGYSFVNSIYPYLSKESILFINAWKIKDLELKKGVMDAFKTKQAKIHFFTEETLGFAIFILEKKEVTYDADSVKHLTECIKSNIPTVFLKYGDGEMEASLFQKGANCDGTPYTNNLGEAVLASIRTFKTCKNQFFGGHMEEYWETKIDYKPRWCVYHSIIIDDLDDNEKKELWKIIQQNKRKKIYIANKNMHKAKYLFNIQKHIEIDPVDWFDKEFNLIVEKVIAEIDDPSNTMILFSAGMGAKPLCAEVYKRFPDCIYLDLGSALDLICTKKSTRAHHSDYSSFSKYLGDILPESWDMPQFLFPEIGKAGRLGNTMFQYAAMKAFGLEKGIPVFLPIDIDERVHDGQKCLLKYFKLTALKYEGEIKIEKKYTFPPEEINEDRTQYLQFDTPISFAGHPESEQFFLKYKKEICNEFEFVDEINNFANEYIKNIKKDNLEVVSIHLRRGDRQWIDQHPTWFLSYIRFLMQYAFQDKNYLFLIFSGGSTEPGNSNKKDIEWCKNHFPSDENIMFCEVNDTIKELAIMTKCDHNILTTRSTLAWWGAYLNKNPEKRVYVPKRFPGEVLNADVFWPSDFKKIEC